MSKTSPRATALVTSTTGGDNGGGAQGPGAYHRNLLAAFGVGHGLLGQFARFDPALGRGYRIGDHKPVPAYSGFQVGVGTQLVPPVVLADYGSPNRVHRWKVTVHVADPDGNDAPRSGAGLRFTILAKMENELIPRRCFVTVGSSQVLYAPGRSIRILALNPMDFQLEAHYNLDEFAGGLSTWEDMQYFGGSNPFSGALAAEADLNLPPFCSSFEVFSPGAGAPAPRLRAYGPGGVVVYDEVLTVPASGEIERIPNVDYTLDITGAAPQTHMVLYQCTG